MLLNSFYPDDIRVRKEAEALLKAGFQVYLLCYRRKKEQVEEIVDGIHVRRVYIGESKWAEGLWDMVNAKLFYHPPIARVLKKLIRQQNIRVVHVHDLPLSGTILRIKKRTNVKVILDLHENYPDALKIWFEWRKSKLINLKNRIFFNYKKWFEYERQSVNKSDHVIAVVDEMKIRLMDDHGLNSSKISVITNTESREFAKQKKHPDLFGYNDGFTILYTGNIGPHRGVETVIRAMAYLKDYKNIYFVIAGSASNDVMEMLKDTVRKEGVERCVNFMGYQPFEYFYSLMSQASVNVIPHNRNGHTDHTIPHKLFQAMITGNPVLVSSCKPLKRIVEQYECGVVFEAANPYDCSQKILQLYNDELNRAKLGENGKKATLEGKLNWEETEKKLSALYESIMQES